LLLVQSSHNVAATRIMRELVGNQINDINLTDVSE